MVMTVPILIPVEPVRLMISLVPSIDTIAPAGDSIPMQAMIYDDTGGRHPDLADSIAWTLTPAGTRNYLKYSKGAANVVYVLDPYSWLTVAVRYQINPDVVLVDSARFYLKPSVAHKLFIESDTVNCSGSGALQGCFAPSPLDSIVFSGAVVQKTAVAIVRDTFGNFARYSATGEWKLLSGNDEVSLSFPKEPYIALVQAIKPGTAFVEVTDTAGGLTIKDTVKVIVKDDIVSVKSHGAPLETLGKSRKAVSEFFNLRGQRLPSNLYGISCTDGIVLERTIDPTGKVCVKKSFVPNP